MLFTIPFSDSVSSSNSVSSSAAAASWDPALTPILGLFQAAEKISALRFHECKRCLKDGVYVVNLSVYPDECCCEARYPGHAFAQVAAEDEDPQQCVRNFEVGCQRIEPTHVALYRHYQLSSQRLAQAVKAYHWLWRRLKKAA